MTETLVTVPRELIADTIARVLARVNAITSGGPGWTRPSYSPLESAAHAVIEEEARALGCEIRRDAAGNMFATLP
ncbi:MAG: Zn-dependent hydrolase, partial [Pseudooceanicola nanhaiensis]